MGLKDMQPPEPQPYLLWRFLPQQLVVLSVVALLLVLSSLIVSPLKATLALGLQRRDQLRRPLSLQELLLRTLKDVRLRLAPPSSSQPHRVELLPVPRALRYPSRWVLQPAGQELDLPPFRALSL